MKNLYHRLLLVIHSWDETPRTFIVYVRGGNLALLLRKAELLSESKADCLRTALKAAVSEDATDNAILHSSRRGGRARSSTSILSD